MHALIHYCLLSSKISYSFRLMAMKRAPKRAYSDNYLQFGFTSLVTDGIEKPQCVICLKTQELQLKRLMLFHCVLQNVRNLILLVKS